MPEWPQLTWFPLGRTELVMLLLWKWLGRTPFCKYAQTMWCVILTNTNMKEMFDNEGLSVQLHSSLQQITTWWWVMWNTDQQHPPSHLQKKKNHQMQISNWYSLHSCSLTHAHSKSMFDHNETLPCATQCEGQWSLCHYCPLLHSGPLPLVVCFGPIPGERGQPILFLNLNLPSGAATLVSGRIWFPWRENEKS